MKALWFALSLLLMPALCLADTSKDFSVKVRVHGFYVATTGSDSNPGTLASPFLTLGKCKTAMRGSSTKTCYIRAGTYNMSSVGTICGSDGIELDSSADNGEVWSYYPPDGVNSAILDGGSTGTGVGVSTAFCIAGGSAASITIDGIQIQRFGGSAIYMVGASNSIFRNNKIHDINMPVLLGLGAITVREAANVSVLNNYIYNIRDNGVSIHSTISGSMNNTSISGNFTYNTCTAVQDCGALYTEDEVFPSSTGVVISNNYIRDSGFGLSGNGYTGAVGIYLDAGVDGKPGSSSESITGNIISGAGDFCFQIHGGQNNTFTGNICDESSGGGKAILYFQQNPSGPSAMTGNVLSHNIIIAGSGGAAGLGYTGDGTAPNPSVANNNAYYNYVGSSVVSTGNNGAGSDSNPTYENPQISCWAAAVAQGSPVFGSPVFFPGIAGGWGPPGFAVPHTGTAPSWPHAC